MNYILPTHSITDTSKWNPSLRWNKWIELVFEEYGALDCIPDDKSNFHGNLIAKSNDLLSVSEVKCSSQYIEKNASHLSKPQRQSHIKIIVLLKGSAECRHDMGHSKLNCGDILILDSERTFRLNFNVEYHALVIQIEKLATLPNVFHLANESGRVLSGCSGLGFILRKMLINLSSQFSELDVLDSIVVTRQVLELLIVACSARKYDTNRSSLTIDNSLFYKIKSYTNANIANQDLAAKKIADHFGVSLRKVYLIFKEQGISPQQYIQQRRLLEARAMLSNFQNSTVLEVALSAGFKCPSHFSRAFKKHFGITPSDLLAR